jgi:Na+-driven multidrug efflux pump
VVQACFLPVVALGIAVAPVAGQNFAARQAERVRATFRAGLRMAIGLMAVVGVICFAAATPMVDTFTDDPQVILIGAEYLRIVAVSFVASGIVFVASSMFQALGNTVPPLTTSFIRVIVVATPVLLLSRLAGFQLSWIWYIGVAALWAHAGANVLMLEREFRRRLPG